MTANDERPVSQGSLVSSLVHDTVGPAGAKGGAAADAEPTAAGSAGKPAAGLHVVATPIGNLRDITLRALDVLAGVDLIACEDTRVTSRLLARYALRVPLLSYNDHNAADRRPNLLARLHDGAAIALVSDAGTPTVSDPGYRLITACIEAGIAVHTLPGASAVLAALVLAGVPTDRFLMVGFLPVRHGARHRAIDELASVPASVVIYESARRLPATLADLAAALGPRAAAVAREITKLHEETRRGPLDALARHYADAGPPKGEVVIVIGPPGPPVHDRLSDAEIDARLAALVPQVGVREAARRLAAETGLPRRDLYARAQAGKDAAGALPDPPGSAE